MMKILRLVVVFFCLAVIVTSITAIAAQNTVPTTRIGSATVPLNINTLVTAQCGGITLTNLVTGAGTITGTAANDLILASLGDDTINGGAGSDCIIAGAGNDTVDGGGAETDICLGGETVTNCNP